MQFMRFGISREVAKSILGEDWIQKSKKGEQKSDHKYIWRTPKETGKGYDYIYEEDQVKNPFDMLLKFFKIGKATVTKLYKDHNIEADYKATENQFASHVLEYEAKKDKWDKIFSSVDKNKATQNPKTMAQAKDIEKKNAEKKGKEAVKKLEGKKFVPNKTLMRKIWAIRNPEKAKEMDILIAQMNAEKSKGVAETIDRQKLGNDKIRNDYVGRRATIDKDTGITTFRFGDGTVIQRDKKNNIVFDSRYDDVPKQAESVSMEQLKAGFKNEILNDRAMYETIKNEIKNTPFPGLGETVEALITANTRKLEAEGKDFVNGPESLAYSEALSEIVKEIREKENENKPHGNEIAMLGNDNAKKDFVEPEVAAEAANIEAQKNEYLSLVDRLNELEKEFKSNGGYSYKHTTSEQDAKRKAARKEISVVEAKLRDMRQQIVEENKGNVKIPFVFTGIINEWLKRKMKAQTISSDWLNKKFGGYYSSNVGFGDGYEFDLGATEEANNPVVRINYEEYGRPSYTSFEVGKMNDEQYQLRYAPRDPKIFTEVYNKFNAIKEQINNAAGNTPAEKFYNMTLGESNEFAKDSTPANVPTLRFTKDGIKDKSGKLEKINATIRNEGEDGEYITLYADNYGSSIPSIFYPENDTDIMTDYFEKDSCDVKPNHPYYNHLKVMALKRELYQGKVTKWNKMSEADQKKLEKKIKNLESKLKEPTVEELKDYREYRDGVEKNKEIWEEASRKVTRQEQEKAKKQKEENAMNTLRNLIGKLQESLAKEPPVNLEGLTKDQKITTLENRIAKLSLEINNLSDAETVESKKQFREKLQARLEEVRNEPEETEAEKTQNRSEAMMDNDNAAGKRGSNVISFPKTSSNTVESVAENETITEENVENIPTEKVNEENTVEQKKQKLDNLWNQRGQGNGFELDKKIENAKQELHEAEMKEKDAEDGIVTPVPTVNADVARRVNDISMSGHSGDVYQHDINVEMKEFREMFDTSKMNDQQKAYFQERLNSYAGLVGDSYNEMASKRLSAGPSWVVAGPAKFNNKRFAQKMDSERRAYEEFKEKKEKFIKNTQKQLRELKYTGGAESTDEVKQRVFDDYAKGNYSWNDRVDNTDPYAVEKISGKIKFLEDAHDVTLIYRKLCQKNKISNVDWTDRTDEDKAKRVEVKKEAVRLAKEKGIPDKAIKEGINSPFTANQTADIRRNKERLEELKKRQSKIEERAANAGSEGGSNTGRVDFAGGYIYENPEMDRIQIIYDGKPERDVINKLKSNGFRWSPSQGAWQRQLNRNGRMAVNRVMAETGIDTKIDIDGAGEVAKSVSCYIPQVITNGKRFLIRKSIMKSLLK